MLRKLSKESSTQYKISDNKYDHAFQALYTEFLDKGFRPTSDKVLKENIILSARQAIEEGLIQNTYVIELYDNYSE